VIRAIIFDFDGVIVDSETEKFKTLKKILKDYNIVLRENAFKHILGKKTGVFLNEEFPELSQQEKENIIQERREHTKEKLPLIPGITALLTTLYDKYLIALVTGSEKNSVERILKENNLTQFFNQIITGEQFSSSKPDPECYNIALKKMRVQPSEAIIIEDSPSGILAGKNAGCCVFALTTSQARKYLHHADKIFDSHDEIHQYLQTDLNIRDAKKF
jgi:HAD superfamily hydrolase (TIGR01509 family)